MAVRHRFKHRQERLTAPRRGFRGPAFRVLGHHPELCDGVGGDAVHPVPLGTKRLVLPLGLFAFDAHEP